MAIFRKPSSGVRKRPKTACYARGSETYTTVPRSAHRGTERALQTIAARSGALGQLVRARRHAELAERDGPPQAAGRALRLLVIYGVATIDRRHAVWQRFHYDKSPDGYLRAVREHDVGDFGIRQDIGNPVPDQSVFDEA